MPSALKRRARRRRERPDRAQLSTTSPSATARGRLRASPFEPSGRTGAPPRSSGGSVLLRMPPELKDALVGRARSAGRTVNELIVGTLSERLGLDQRKGSNGLHERLAERPRAREGQGPRRDHRRRQLRQLAPPGRAVLQGREPGRLRPRADARRPRRLPHPRHRVRRRLRRRQGQGRRRPRRRDLGAPERHDQVRRRPEDRRHGLPRDDARRHRQVPVRGRREGAGRDRRRGRDPQGDRRGRRRQLPPGRLRGGDEVVRRADPRRPAARW